MKRYVERFEDFYGCTYSILQQPDGTYRMAARTPHGSLFHMKTYSTEKGVHIALGKLTEGTARPLGRQEVI